MDYYSALKNMSHQVMKRHGGMLNEYYYMKEDNKKATFIWFNYLTFPKRHIYWHIETSVAASGWGEVWLG